MMNRRHFLGGLTAASPLLLSPWQGAAAQVSRAASGIAPLSEAFLATVPQLMDVASLPGLGIGVVQDGQLAAEHYFGVIDTESNARVSATTLFPAASLGKPVFAWAVLQLSDEGRIELDRPLFDYLPASERPTTTRELRVTARHVLSHSSGFRNWRQEFNEPFSSRFEPGTKFMYSGEGYYLLQRCVEHVTGTGTEQFMREHMDRLGMKDSTFLWRADAMERIAQGHSFFRDNQPSRSYWDFNAKVFESMHASGQSPSAWRHEQTLDLARQLKRDLTAQGMRPNVASGLFTTVRDYTTFLSRLARVRGDADDLKPATRAGMLAAHSRVNALQGWGLGIGLESATAGGAPEYLWQWGDNGGGIWKNFALVHPATGAAIVAFSNGTYGMRVIERIMRASTARDLAAFLWVG